VTRCLGAVYGVIDSNLGAFPVGGMMRLSEYGCYLFCTEGNRGGQLRSELMPCLLFMLNITHSYCDCLVMDDCKMQSDDGLDELAHA